MSGTTAAERTVELRDLYAPLQARMMCRSCGLAGWDVELAAK